MADRTEGLKSLGRDTMWAAINDGAMLVVALLTFTLVVRSFGQEEYGAYLGAFGIVAPLTGLAWNGVALTALQRVIREGESPSLVASQCFTIMLPVAAFSITAVLLLGSLLVPTLSVFDFVGLAGAELVGSAIVGVTAAIAQGVKSFGAAARVRLAAVMLKAVTVVALYLTDTLTIRGIGFGLMGVMACLSLYLLTVYLPSLGVKPRLMRLSKPFVRDVGSFGLPILVSSIQSDGDKTALNAYGMPAVAGAYGAAFRVVQFAMMPINAFDNAVFQRFLSHDPLAKDQHLRRAKFSAGFTTGLGIVIAGVLYFMAPLLPILAGDQFEESTTMVRWLLLLMPMYAVSTAPMNGLLGLGKLQLRAIIFGIAAFVSIACYVILVPSLTWVGGLIGTLAGEGTVAVLGWYYLFQKQREHNDALDVGLSAYADDEVNADAAG